MPSSVIFNGEHYSVRQNIVSDEPLCVVCFQYFCDIPNRDGAYFGEYFLSSRSINSIGILPAENDWYQHREIFDVISAIRTAAAGMTIVGYGGSMGAYGVINYSDLLGLQRVFAIAPQFSIDRRRMPHEHRWGPEAQRIDFRHDRIDQIPPVAGYVAYDPWTDDRAHADRIMAHHSLKPLRLPLSGHSPGGFLNETGLNPGTTLEILRGADVCPEDVRREARKRRIGSPTAWVGASDALWHRGRRAWALRMAQRGADIGAPNHHVSVSHYARLLWQSGDREAAIRALERCADHPDFGPTARRRIAEWQRSIERSCAAT